MKKLLTIIIIFIIPLPIMLWAGAAKEAASTAERGEYLAERGLIIRPEEIYVDSYIAHIDYQYPKSKEDVGITIYSGHHQISSRGQEEVIQIGIQGKELGFEELPPMNLAFVIDKSGSMADRDKMDWVKEAFDIFINKVRDKDYVSLIVFDSTARVVFSSTRMDTKSKRERFRNEVLRTYPNGGTNLVEGLKLGFKEVLSNYRKEYTNRVLFLTDGVGESTGILEMAETYKNMGINVSTIGVGTDFDLELMRNLADRGGGSSRFISGREEMEETFGSELDRMVVPVANDMKIRLEFLQKVDILGTWGYNNRIEGNTIHYYLSTLHHRDYETILVQVKIHPQRLTGERYLARLSLDYTDLGGKKHYGGPYYLKTNFMDMEFPVTGFSDGKVLQSGTMLHLAQALKMIGRYYYSNQVQQALDLTIETKKELQNARLRLDNEGFDDEIRILENYIRIFGGDLKYVESDTERIVEDYEIKPFVQERSLQEHLENLFREMTLAMGTKEEGGIAVSGFTTKEGGSSNLVNLLNEMALVEITKHKDLQVVERERLDMIMEEQRLALSDLMDTSNAIEIGKLLAVNHILTGSVIEMPHSVVIFGRIINVETAEVESAAQVIVPRSKDVEALL
jgi:TolB-like protein